MRLFSDAVPLAQRPITTSRRSEPYLPLQHRYSPTYESFADIFAREGRSAPPLDPDSSDATALPGVEQSTFAGGEKSMWSAKGSATSRLGRWPQHRSPSASFQRKRTHKESGKQESSQLLPAPVRSFSHAPPKRLDEDGFVVPTHIRIRPASESPAQAFPSPSKRIAIPASPSSTSSISKDFVICMSSTSTPSPGRTESRARARYQSSLSLPSPLLLAKIIRLNHQSGSVADDGWSALDPDQEEEEEEVNLHSIVRRRLSFGGARSVSHAIEILRETFKEKHNARRDADLERLKPPPAS
ncbi:hypothetical protein FRC00_002867 [Tulasnella sp. 408]|nr:hypothetical protein FRC00_002867 [Tulasnella sp. 408]